MISPDTDPRWQAIFRNVNINKYNKNLIFTFLLFPANAGMTVYFSWIPACAGMTAKAGMTLFLLIRYEL